YAIHELEGFRRRRIVPPACQACFEERGIKQLAGIIAEKWTFGTVGALETRREPNNEQLGAVGAERWHRAIEPIGGCCSVVIAKGTGAGERGAVLGGCGRF